MGIITNEHVNVDTTISVSFDKFTPDDGYELWMDDEVGNLDDETGEPLCYLLNIHTPKNKTKARAPHIWAKLIDDIMEVFGDGNNGIEIL